MESEGGASPIGSGGQRAGCRRSPGPARRDLRAPAGCSFGSSQPRVPRLLTLSDQSDWLRETGALSKLFGIGVPHDYAEAAARYRAIPQDALSSYRGAAGTAKHPPAVRRIPSLSVFPVSSSTATAPSPSPPHPLGRATLDQCLCTKLTPFVALRTGGRGSCKAASERLLSPFRPPLAVCWKQHPMGRRAQCFQTRHSLHAPRLPAAARRQFLRKTPEPPGLPGAGRGPAEPLPAAFPG